jgi:MFS transporter, DHA1 family, multidrug resistance protein
VGSAGRPAAETRSPDGPSDWRRLTAVFVVVSFIETAAFGHFFAFLPILVRSLGVASGDAGTTVGLLSTVALLLGLPLVPFWGAWADRHSRKLIVVRSALVEGVLFLLLGLCREIWQVFLLVPLVGLVLGNTGVMLAEITDRTPRARLGFAMSLVGTASPLGIALGPALGGALADTFGVQLLFLMDAVLAGVSTLLLLAFYRERAERPRTRLTVMQLVRRSLAAVIRTRLARGVFLTYFFVLLGQRVVFPFLALYVEVLNGSQMLATAVGLVAGAYGVAAAIGSPLAGRLGDRIGYRPVFAGAVLIVVACFLVASAVGSLVPFGIAYALYGVGFATATSMLYTLLATGLPTEVRSSVLNLALAPLYVSGIVGSLISTQVLVLTGGDLRPLWLIGAVFCTLALLPLRTLRPHPATLSVDGTEVDGATLAA